MVSNPWCRSGRPLLALLVGLLMPGLALAQMALPGAVAPAPEGTVQTPQPARPRPKSVSPLLAPAQVPPIDGLAGKTLSLNGGTSQVTFTPHDKDVDVSRLTLTGALISNARALCQIEGPKTPIAVKPMGRPNGVDRVELDFPACPIAFDVLDGAVLVDRTQATCEFKQADCHIDIVGLWGPQSGDLGPDKAKGIEHARAQAETSVRTSYKALVASTKDRVAIAGYARDQAQFSSTREEICRDYVGEGRHGFCATKLTEARAAFLRAKLGDALEAKSERKKQHAARSKLAKP